jgi:hypothetical protein
MERCLYGDIADDQHGIARVKLHRIRFEILLSAMAHIDQQLMMDKPIAATRQF